MRDNYLTPVEADKTFRHTQGNGRRDSRRIVDGNRNGSHDGRMENRVRELEKTAIDVRERLVKIEARLERVATSASIEKMAGELKAAIEKIGSRLDAQNAKFDAKFEAQSASLKAQNAKFDAKFEAQMAKLDLQNANFNTTFAIQNTKFETQNTKFEVLNTRIESVRADLIRWFVTTAIVLAGLAFTAARFIH